MFFMHWPKFILSDLDVQLQVGESENENPEREKWVNVAGYYNIIALHIPFSL